MFEKRHSDKLDSDRRETLSEIHDERSSFEAMVQRARAAGAAPLDGFAENVLAKFDKITETAQSSQSIDEINSAGDDADQQGQLRAYLCPIDEIEDEGRMLIDTMDEWNVPTAVIQKLRDTFLPKLKDAQKSEASARSALRAIYEEHDSWSRYTTYYEDEMRRFTRILTIVIAVSIGLAIVCFHFTNFVIVGLVCTGVAGSCISVISKMPLVRVALSGELESYERRILSRISLGTAASIVGSGMLGWGLITVSVGKQTFDEAVSSCTTGAAPCSPLRMLILLAVPIIFGFSERALTTFESHFFGNGADK
jgi:hypothetical protein